ncbi:MAG: hypothetical protein LBI70_03715 [Rickettsiales bacterium]|jgi:hypothetical protein|nr:hypothetical protein [Rickettsiales bacterium]
MVSFSSRENIISNFLWGNDSWDGKKLDKKLIKEEIDSYAIDDLKDRRRMHFMLRDAVEAGNEEIAKYLLARGACPIVIYNDGSDTIRGEYAVTDIFTENGHLGNKFSRETENIIFKKTLEIIDGTIHSLEENQSDADTAAGGMFTDLNEKLREKLENLRSKIASGS